LLRRFDEVARPPRREWQPRPPRPFTRSRGAPYPPPPQPASDAAKALGTAGLAPPLARAVLSGLLHYPDLIAAHAEAIAALTLDSRELARLRDHMLDAAFANESLDREGLLTILADNGAGSLVEGLSHQRGLAFSFTSRTAEPERAQRDLVLVVDTLAARPELDAAFAAATARLKEAFDEATFAEQVRLRIALEELDRRLARLVLDE
jgi:DNA primase